MVHVAQLQGEDAHERDQVVAFEPAFAVGLRGAEAATPQRRPEAPVAHLDVSPQAGVGGPQLVALPVGLVDDDVPVLEAGQDAEGDAADHRAGFACQGTPLSLSFNALR